MFVLNSKKYAGKNLLILATIAEKLAANLPIVSLVSDRTFNLASDSQPSKEALCGVSALDIDTVLAIAAVW